MVASREVILSAGGALQACAAALANARAAGSASRRQAFMWVSTALPSLPGSWDAEVCSLLPIGFVRDNV